MIAVNFFGGAGIGKSTIAAEVFARLKALGVNAELVGEMAKDVILQNNFSALEDQLWLFANQAHRMRGMAQMGVQVAVCDSPLPLSLIYGAARDVDDNQTFSDLVWQEFDKYQNINFIL
jgi:adenylylsulfate kinase-like enzyme